MLSATAMTEAIDRTEELAAELLKVNETKSGFSAIRPRHMEPIVAALESCIEHLVHRGVRSQRGVAERLAELAATIKAHPGAEFARVRNRAILAATRLHVFLGDWPAADRAIDALVFRPQMACEDMDSVRHAMRLDRAIRPNVVTSQEALAALFMERLLFLMTRFTGAEDCLDLIADFGPQLASLLCHPPTREYVAAACGISVDLLARFVPAMQYFDIRRAWGAHARTPRRLAYRFSRGRPFRSLLKAIITTSRARTTFAISRSSIERYLPLVRPSGVLVTRGMGGAGDIVMMLPGLVARARRSGERVHFAVPPALMGILDGIPEIVPLSCAAALAFEEFREWINLGECPAGRYEASVLPHVVKSRIEVFAAALDVGTDELDTLAWSAPFRLDSGQRALANRLRREARARDQLLVGVAPYSREEYRRVPALVTAAERLATQHSVILLHSRPAVSLQVTGLPVLDAPDISGLIAAIAACDYVIATDTAQLHLAAALGVPTLAVFGPTGGHARVGSHPNVRVLQQETGCAFMPCWRNEDSACRLTGGRESACLRDLTAEAVLAEFDLLVTCHPGESAPAEMPLAA